MVNKAIQNRRSVRKYSEKQVTDEVIEEIIKAAQFSPTAMNRRGWEFMVIKNSAAKEEFYKLTAGLLRQDSIKKAPVVLVPLIDTKKSALPIQDLSLAIENILIQITELGLGGFWKNIRPKEEKAIKEAFGIPDRFALLNIIPIGYPANGTKPHSDNEFDSSKIHWEKW
jgi:nitroreductase